MYILVWTGYVFEIYSKVIDFVVSDTSFFDTWRVSSRSTAACSMSHGGFSRGAFNVNTICSNIGDLVNELKVAISRSVKQ